MPLKNGHFLCLENFTKVASCIKISEIHVEDSCINNFLLIIWRCVMSETPINNRKIVLKPTSKPKLDIGESTIFSKQVDVNLWEAVSQKITPNRKKDNSIQYQIFKAEQETHQYEAILENPNGKKLDLNF
jgi:hypothetical protein